MTHSPNIGRQERRIRLWLGFFLIGIAGFTPLSVWGTLLAFFLGFLVLYTGVHHYCPIWKLFGINTCDHHVKNH